MKREDAASGGELAEIAREYYVKELSQSEIARRRKLQQSTVSHLLQRAREWGVVSFEIDPDFAARGIEHREKSRGLRDAFGLKEAFVVDVDGDRLLKDLRGDELHTVIANTVASTRLHNWIDAGDHIVIGGGRAPVRAARMIKRTSPSRRDVRVSPLSGRIWTGSYQEEGSADLERPLDGDDAARLLAAAYEHEPGTRYSQIGLPLYQEASQVEGIIEQECTFRRGGGWNRAWGIKDPVKALVGVGVVHRESGHRMPELLKSLEKARGAEFTPNNAMEWAAQQFGTAMHCAEESGLPAFGDLANRAFACLFLPSEMEKMEGDLARWDRFYETLRGMLTALNDRAVVMEWTHLREIPSVWAVAGGKLKIHALWTLLIARRLDRERSLIKEIATDVDTSDRLLAELAIYEGLGAERQEWYRSKVSQLF